MGMLFAPEKTPIDDFSYAIGNTVVGPHGSRYVVTERDGFAFVTCCVLHEAQGTGSGWFPQRDHGHDLAVFTLESDSPIVDCQAQ
jgi:hypothetical protein